MPAKNLGWCACTQCSLILPLSDIEAHRSDGHNFDYSSTVSPFISNGIFVAYPCKIEDAGIKQRNISMENHIVYMHPDTMSICKYKRRQPLLLNNNILLQVCSHRSVPLDSVAVTDAAFKNILKSGSQMVTLEAPLLEECAATAWICYISLSCPNYFDKTSPVLSSPHLFKGKRIVFEKESFSVDCFGSVITVSVQSVVSKRNFEVEDYVDDLTSGLNSLSLIKRNSQKEFYVITDFTRFVIVPEKKRNILKLKHIKGMKTLEKTFKLAIQRYFGSTRGPIFDKGCLIHGAQGSGKSTLVEAMADHYGLPLLTPQPSDIFSEDINEFRDNLSLYRDQVSKSVPCFLFFDDIEKFCPLQTLSRHPKGFCIAESFNTFLCNLSLMRCFIIGTTRDVQLIHPSLHFFKVVLEVPIPSTLDRFEILMSLMEHHSIQHSLTKDEVKRATDVAHGFSGYDLNRLCLTLKMKEKSMKITGEDLQNLVHKTIPSILRDVAIESPNVSWKDVGGQEKLKEVLKWSIQKPIEDPSKFKGNVMKGILLYGPPGCSKTMIVKALATECGLNFLWVQGSQLHGKYVGESEQAVKVLFNRARSAAPCVIFFDELDSFAPKRGSGRDTAGVNDRCVSLLMTEMDGISGLKNVFVIAATNRPDHIDPALLRAGRFDTRLYVPLPNLDTRMKILQVCCQKGKVDDDVDLRLLAKKTESFSCAEVTSLYEFAGNAAIAENENAAAIKMKHFIEALSGIVPLTNPELSEWYENLRFLS